MNPFSLVKRADSSGARTGISVADDRAAVAQVRRAGAGRRPRLEYCRYARGGSPDVLDGLLRDLPNRRSPAVDVLRPAAYHLLLVEAPDVPVDELRAAIRWRIKDLIDFHVDDAVVDVFEMPPQGRGGINKMMYAVAARADLVRRQIDTIEDAGLRLEIVDIAELCLRNVGALLEQPGTGVALLYVSARRSILILVRQGVLYLTRRIETGLDALAASDGSRAERVGGLALEARRSLDYVESHYEQSPISTLCTAGLGAPDRDLMAQNLGMPVEAVDLGAVLECDFEIDDETQLACLPAIGAALREDPVTL